MSAAKPKASGGSAVRRLRETLKEAGVLGPRGRKRVAGSSSSGGTADAAKRPAVVVASPFETKTTRRKHDVVGRRVKGTEGHPTQSRTRAIEKRIETLLPEYKKRGRVSEFVDRRFGETDPTLSLEEKMVERFAKERMRSGSRKSLFTLEDDEGEGEELTHLGRSLANIDDFDRTEIDLGVDGDDDDDGGGEGGTRSGQLGENVTSRLNFGGFKDDGEGEGDGSGAPKSKREIMMEVISKSKFYKNERLKAKMEDADMIDKLDEELKQIRDLLPTVTPGETRDHRARRAADEQDGHDDGDDEDASAGADYDSIIQMLAADTRARPTNRLKTPEELALEARQKLEELERERLRRMRGVGTGDNDDGDLDGNLHREDDDDAGIGRRTKKLRAGFSGDDLESNVEPEVNQRKGRQPIAYVNGRLFVDGQEYKHVPLARDPADDEDGDEDDDAEEAEEDDESGEDDDAEEAEEDDESGEDEDEDGDDGEEDAVFQLDGDLDDLDIPAKSAASAPAPDRAALEARRQREAASAKRVREAAKSELPYVLAAPQTHAEFLAVVDGRSADEVHTAVERLRTLHHISLGAGNREKLQLLLAVLLDHVAHACDACPPALDHVQAITPHILELMAGMPAWAGETCRARLQSWSEDIAPGIARRASGDGSGWSAPSTLVLLTIFGQAFPATDLRHPVLSPARLYIASALTRCPLLTERDAVHGLFLCAIAYELHQEARRLFPEALVFLRKSLALVLPTCAASKDRRRPLSALQLLTSGAAANEPLEMDQRLALVRSMAGLLERFCDIYAGFAALHAVLAPVSAVLAELPSGLPKSLRGTLGALRSKIEGVCAEADKRLYPLQMQRRKAVPLKEYTPRIEDRFEPGKKKRDRDPERDTLKKLQAQHKKQFKGAVRELRKDAQFLATVRQGEQQERDTAYKARIKNIESMLQQEQADLKATSVVRPKGKGRRQKGAL